MQEIDYLVIVGPESVYLYSKTAPKRGHVLVLDLAPLDMLLFSRHPVDFSSIVFLLSSIGH